MLCADLFISPFAVRMLFPFRQFIYDKIIPCFFEKGKYIRFSFPHTEGMKTFAKVLVILTIAIGCLFTAAACVKTIDADEPPRDPNEGIMPLPELPMPRNLPHRLPIRGGGLRIPV